MRPPASLSLTVAVCSLAAVPGLASAATTIGQTTDTPGSCMASMTSVRYQHTTAVGSPSYAVPASGGVITSWTTNPGANTGTSTRLEVIREAAGGGLPHTVVGESALQSNIATHNALPFPTRIPVQAGDLVGLELQAPAGGFCASSQPGSDLTVQSTDPGPGNDLPSTAAMGGQRMDVAATVEADADHDGLGDETQDSCPRTAGTLNGCPPADLALTESASPDPSPQHGRFRYLLHVRNNGPNAVAAGDATVDDAVSSVLTLRSATSPGGPCTLMSLGTTAQFARCPVPTLAPGAGTTIAVTVTAGAPNHYSNNPGLLYGGDTNLANNSAGFAATVVRGPGVSATKMSPLSWPAGVALPRISRKRAAGTTISFSLAETAKATLTFSQPKAGRKVGHHCRPLTPANRGRPRCTVRNVRGVLTLTGHTGKNKVRFQGRLSRSKKLRRGHYALTITARDSAGNRSTGRTIGFTIVR